MGRRTTQVDPFNAGDPIMPWDELGDEFVPLDAGADWTAPHDTSGSSTATAPVGSDSYPTASYPTTNAGHASAEKGAGRSRGGRGRGAGRQSQARSQKPRRSQARAGAGGRGSGSGAGGYAGSGRAAGARSTGAAQSAQSAQSTARTATRKVVGLIRMVVILGIFVTVGTGIVGSVVSCSSSAVSIVFGSGDDSTGTSESTSFSFGSSSERADYDDISDELSSQLGQDFRGRLDAIKQGEDTSYDETAAKALDDEFVIYSGGLTLEGAGLDSHELARWLLSQIEYDPSDVYSNVYLYAGQLSYEGTASVTVTVPSYYELSYALTNYLRSAFGNDALASSSLTDAQKSQLKAQMPTILQQVPRNEQYVSVDTIASVNEDGSDPQVSLDEKSFDENIESLVGIYPES